MLAPSRFVVGVLLPFLGTTFLATTAVADKKTVNADGSIEEASDAASEGEGATLAPEAAESSNGEAEAETKEEKVISSDPTEGLKADTEGVPAAARADGEVVKAEDGKAEEGKEAAPKGPSKVVILTDLNLASKN